MFQKNYCKIIFKNQEITEKWIIHGVYAPSSNYSKEIRDRWWRELYNDIDKNSHEYLQILIGDLNIHLIEDLDHTKDANCYIPEGVEQINNILGDLYRIQNPTKIKTTYHKGEIHTRIDYALIDYELIEDVTLITYAASNLLISPDHDMIVICIKTPIFNSINGQIKPPIYKEEYYNPKLFYGKFEEIFKNKSENIELNNNPENIELYLQEFTFKLKDIFVESFGKQERTFNSENNVTFPKKYILHGYI